MEEKELVKLVSIGDEQGFRLLLKRYERVVKHIVNPLVKSEPDREELVQDIFIKVFYRIRSFRGESKLSTWIGKVAYHHCLNYLRRKRIVFEYIDEHDFENMQTPVTKEEDLNNHSELILIALERLPEIHKLIIQLYHIDEMGYNEIAEILNLSPGTVKSRLFRARAFLKQILDIKNLYYD